MTRATTRYFDNLDEAIKVARKRAQSNYCTQGIYQNEEKKLFIANTLNTKFTAIAKVKFDGTVEHLTQEQPK